MDEVIKLKEINNELLLCEIENIGLLSGLSGINYALMHLKTKDYKKKIKKNINQIINQINNGNLNFTYNDGIVGFAWSLRKLINNEIINEDEYPILGQLKTIFYKRMMAEIEKKNYDFLHGSIGVGLYFNLNVKDNFSYRSVKELVNLIDEIKIEEDSKVYKWESYLYSQDKPPLSIVNTGLAHGSASVISFLTKVYKNEICKLKTKKIINGAVQYLLKNQNELLESGCYFPNWIEKGNKSNRFKRLSWCYGDMGISISLYNAAQILENKELKEFALQVLLHSTNTKNLELIIDAGLCHGSTGIAQMYNRMYWNTNNVEFKRASDFWFMQSLKMAKFEDGLAGYKKYCPNEEISWKNEYSILEGIAGIGLALNSWINKEEPKWDECILLS